MKPLNINPPTKPLRPIHPQTLHSLLALAAENRPENPGSNIPSMYLILPMLKSVS